MFHFSVLISNLIFYSHFSNCISIGKDKGITPIECSYLNIILCKFYAVFSFLFFFLLFLGFVLFGHVLLCFVTVLFWFASTFFNFERVKSISMFQKNVFDILKKSSISSLHFTAAKRMECNAAKYSPRKSSLAVFFRLQLGFLFMWTTQPNCHS